MVQVKLFGMLKTLVEGNNMVTIPIAEGALVKDLVAAVQQHYPALGDLLHQKKVVVSVNQEIAHWETALSDSDEIALLPPFAGGA